MNQPDPYQQYPQPTYYQPQQPPAPRKRRRIGMWVFLAVQVLFLIWIIAGAASATHNPHCTGLDQSTCQSATNTGTAIGVFLIIVLWAAVDVIWGVTYLIVRSNRRPR